MSEIRFWTISKREFPQLSYIFSNLEPPGMGLKNVACYVTGDLILIKIYRGKEGMKNIK